MALISIEDRRKVIGDRLEKIFTENDHSSLLALDLEINFLICATLSYKQESALKPFPSTLLSDSNNDKNYSLLVSTLVSLPPVLEWRFRLKSFNRDQLNIVYWLFFHKNYALEYKSIDQEQLKNDAKFIHDFSKPTHVFEVKYSEEKERKFEELKKQTMSVLNSESVTSMSFHGTRMDNIYSILHTGLLAHLNKNGLFGEGTYLSQEPSISLHYSPSCKSWDKSLIGQRMSCMLVCETINDPKHVKIGINDRLNAQSKSAPSREQEASSAKLVSNNNVPEKYFIVKNNDYVRIKYLLVYAEKAKSKRRNKLIQFLNEHKFFLFLLSYFFLLLFVGLLNSRVFHKYVKLSYQKLTDYLTSSLTSYD